MTQYSIRVFDGDPADNCGGAWPSHDGYPLDAETIAEAREEARDIIDTEAYGLCREDGYAVGDRIYATIDDAADGGMADIVSVELTTEHLGEEDDDSDPVDGVDDIGGGAL